LLAAFAHTGGDGGRFPALSRAAARPPFAKSVYAPRCYNPTHSDRGSEARSPEMTVFGHDGLLLLGFLLTFYKAKLKSLFSMSVPNYMRGIGTDSGVTP